MNSIEVNRISKSYGTIRALSEVTFEVAPGELFGLIGPDGAGKTSMFRILTTLLLPDSGSARVEGKDIVTDYYAIRSMVGYMPGKFSLYPDLSIEENLQFFATVFNSSIEENYELIRDIYVQLEPFRKRRAGKLSGGMKQKLALCCALVHRPSVLFLDEPTTGVDPVSRKEFWQMLARLREKGITILVSTPYMDEASLCDRIALIQNGRLLSVDRPSVIVNRYPHHLLAIRAGSMPRLLDSLQRQREVLSSYAFGEYAHVAVTDAGMASSIEHALRAQGFQELEIKETVPTIEDCFIELLKQ